MLEKMNKTKLLADSVADQINDLIKDRQLHPGDKLPSEMELMEALNVGRGTVREAVKILVSRNVLVIKRGIGTFVSEHTGQIDDPLGFNYVEDKEKLFLDTLELRSWIELNMAKCAAKTASDEQISELKKLCDVIEAQLKENKDHTQADIKFHTLIANCTDNLVISNLIPIISVGVTTSISLTQSILKEETIHTHREIVNCIAAHDEQGAYNAMKKHIDENQRCAKKMIQK